MNKGKLASLYLMVIVSFIGCNSLPKNVTQKEYNSVRDYVSVNIAGMTYLELSLKLNQQGQPQYYPNGGVLDLPYYKEEPGSNFSKYNEYMMEISNKMNQLTSRYKRTDQVESFYSWAVGNYNE